MRKVTEKRTMLYMPADLYGRVSSAARLSGKTMAAFVRDALSKVVQPEMTQEEYRARLRASLSALKGVFKEDGLTYQRRMRAGWKERERWLWAPWRKKRDESGPGHQRSD